MNLIETTVQNFNCPHCTKQRNINYKPTDSYYKESNALHSTDFIGINQAS